MAVGQFAQLGGLSYLAVGRETTMGTYNTCTAALDVISCSIKTTQDNKIIEQIERARTYSKRISLMKKIQGDIEFYISPNLDATGFILQNVFGGTVTSATATGETVGAGASSAVDHTFAIGNFDQSWPSLCINMRKGDSTHGEVFHYSGLRVNSINFSAQMDEALKGNINLIGLDSTIGSDVSAALTVTSAPLLSFVDGRVSVETSFASLTSTSFWHVQSAEFGINNNLKADADSGRIGSQILTVLPPGIAQFTLKCKIRFDTTTAYSAMLNSTQLAVQLDFVGPTLTSSSIRQKLRFNFPRVFVNSADDPSIGGPDQILMSDIDFHVLRDDSSATGYAVQAVLTSQKQSWA
jgi:hypothetical protein